MKLISNRINFESSRSAIYYEEKFNIEKKVE